MAEGRPNYSFFEPFQLNLSNVIRDSRRVPTSELANSGSGARAHVLAHVEHPIRNSPPGVGHALVGSRGTLQGVGASGFPTPASSTGVQPGSFVSPLTGQTAFPVSSGIAHWAEGGGLVPQPIFSPARENFQGLGASGHSMPATSASVQPWTFVSPPVGETWSGGSSGVAHLVEAGRKNSQASVTWSGVNLQGVEAPGYSTPASLAGLQPGVSGFPSLVESAPLGSSGVANCAGGGGLFPHPLVSRVGGTQSSPLFGGLPVGSGNRPLGLPSTHAGASSFHAGMGQSWHGGMHSSPGIPSSLPGVGCLLPQSSFSMAYGGLDGSSGSVRDNPGVPPLSSSFSAGVGDNSGLPANSFSAEDPILGNRAVSSPFPNSPAVHSPDSPVAPSEVGSQAGSQAGPQSGPDLISLPSLLASLETVDPSLVTERASQAPILTDAETLARASRPTTRELVATESPILASFLSSGVQEIRGFDGSIPSSEGQDPLSLGPNPLRTGKFLGLNKGKMRPFLKPSPPIACSSLPARSLYMLEAEKAVLPSFEGKSSPSLAALIPDRVLADWEESHRLALENSSLLERFIDLLYKDSIGALPNESSLSEDQRSALLLASAKCIKSNMHLDSRSYLNTVLARRDALLAKAKSRMTASEKDNLRALPLDSTGILGPKAMLSPSLRPPSESTAALLEVAKAFKAAPQRNDNYKPSPSKKRPNTASSKENAQEGKGSKRQKFAGKANKGHSGPKASPAKKAVPPP